MTKPMTDERLAEIRDYGALNPDVVELLAEADRLRAALVRVKTMCTEERDAIRSRFTTEPIIAEYAGYAHALDVVLREMEA